MSKSNSNGDTSKAKYESERSLPPTKRKPPVPKNVKPPKDSSNK